MLLRLFRCERPRPSSRDYWKMVFNSIERKRNKVRPIFSLASDAKLKSIYEISTLKNLLPSIKHSKDTFDKPAKNERLTLLKQPTPSIWNPKDTDLDQKLVRSIGSCPIHTKRPPIRYFDVKLDHLLPKRSRTATKLGWDFLFNIKLIKVKNEDCKRKNKNSSKDLARHEPKVSRVDKHGGNMRERKIKGATKHKSKFEISNKLSTIEIDENVSFELDKFTESLPQTRKFVRSGSNWTNVNDNSCVEESKKKFMNLERKKFKYSHNYAYKALNYLKRKRTFDFISKETKENKFQEDIVKSSGFSDNKELNLEKLVFNNIQMNSHSAS